MRERLFAIARDGEGGDTKVLAAPTVGRMFSAPPVGTFLSPDFTIGELRVMQKGYRLTVPAGVSGIVREVFVTDRGAPLEYGQPILALGRAADPEAFETTGGANPAGSDEDVPEGTFAVRSPTDGIFYSRPSPDEPAYVEVGQVVERGKVLGLVEVMKCFNQIAFGAEADAPARAKVVRVVPEDAGEVKLDGVLFILETA